MLRYQVSPHYRGDRYAPKGAGTCSPPVLGYRLAPSTPLWLAAPTLTRGSPAFALTRSVQQQTALTATANQTSGFFLTTGSRCRAFSALAR